MLGDSGASGLLNTGDKGNDRDNGVDRMGKSRVEIHASAESVATYPCPVVSNFAHSPDRTEGEQRPAGDEQRPAGMQPETNEEVDNIMVGTGWGGQVGTNTYISDSTLANPDPLDPSSSAPPSPTSQCNLPGPSHGMPNTAQGASTDKATEPGQAKLSTLHMHIVTVNSTSWSACRDWLSDLPPKERPHVVLVQEHKLATKEAIDDASTSGHLLGYTSIWTMAGKGPKGGPAGGTAILAITQLGLTKPRLPHGAQPHPRSTMGVIQPPRYGRMAVFSAYGVSKLGAKGENLEVIASFPTLADSIGLPFLAGGDFNMAPAALRRTGYGKRGQVAIMQTERHTCVTNSWATATTIDYFV